MIRGFHDKDTERVFNGQRVKRFGADVQKNAQRKLDMLDAVSRVDSLKIPPGNRLERLKREGSWVVITQVYPIAEVHTSAHA